MDELRAEGSMQHGLVSSHNAHQALTDAREGLGGDFSFERVERVRLTPHRTSGPRPAKRALTHRSSLSPSPLIERIHSMTHRFALTVTSVGLLCNASMAAVVPLDIAIIGVNTSTTDSFAIVFLRDVALGETISFTDSGWKSTGVFRPNEGTLTFTAPAAISAGSVRTWTNGMTITGTGWSSSSPTSFALNATGDSLIAYQGTINGTTGLLSGSLVYAVQTFGAWNTDATSASTSAEPTSANGGTLVSGTTTVAISTANGYYTGTTAGTKAQLLAAISNSANWTTSTLMTDTSLWKSGFTVPAPGAAALVGLASLITTRRRKV